MFASDRFRVSTSRLPCTTSPHGEGRDEDLVREPYAGPAQHERDGSEPVHQRGADELSLAERLVNAAVAAGGSDNVTVVVVECELDGVLEASEDTLERGSLPGVLEDTRPRG